MKVTNIDREFLHISWTTWESSMKFSWKMYLKIILIVTKNQSFTLFWRYNFQKTTGGRGIKLNLPSSFGVKEMKSLESLQLKAEAYLDLKREVMMKLSFNKQRIIFTINSIIHSRLCFKETSENNEIFKTKPGWSIPSWLLQRVVF